jgi:ABC-2 type transport system ATP-binding protein
MVPRWSVRVITSPSPLMDPPDQGRWAQLKGFMTTAVHLENIRRRFGKVQALDGLSLRVSQGEVYGFLGRNGAGKTTTLRILMGIVRPDEGTIELLGRHTKRVTVLLKQRIGYVSQEPMFYSWMTAEQLGRFVSGFYPTWDKQEFSRLLDALDVPNDRRAADLSGGTRSKLGLALALAPRPELLLLDEPTAGLDPVARREFHDQLMLLQRERGTTVFFSSHLVGEVEQLAQRVGIVQAGKTRFEGDVAALRASVRRIIADPTFVPTDGFERLRADVYRATVSLWDSTLWPAGTEIRQLSLEDIFLAFTRTDRVVAG